MSKKTSDFIYISYYNDLVELLSSKLCQILGDKWTIGSSGSAVHVVWAAVPVGLWATSSWARGLIRSTLLVGSHLGELLTHGNKRTVSSSGSTVHVVWAAIPVSLWATSSWASGLIRSALFVGSHFGELLAHGNKRTVSSSCSTVHVVWAALPVSLWATSSWARCLIRPALFVCSHLGKLLLQGNKRTVSSSGSTVHVVRTAVPINFRATSSWAHGSFTLLLSSHIDKLCLHSNKGTVSCSSSTVHVVRAAVPVSLWATSSWA